MKKACPKKQAAHPAVTVYQKIEHGVVSGYKKMETAIVSGFHKVCSKCTQALFSKDGETLEETKKRLSNKE